MMWIDLHFQPRAMAHNALPHHAVVFGAKKNILRLSCAYQTAPKTIERLLYSLSYAGASMVRIVVCGCHFI
jgi:hypothetical protein